MERLTQGGPGGRQSDDDHRAAVLLAAQGVLPEPIAHQVLYKPIGPA